MEGEAAPGRGRADGRPAVVGVPGRDLTVEDLSAVNRATTVAHLLPGVAHELNNALQVVTGLVEMLSTRGQLNADAAEKVTRIGGHATRAIGLVREFVSFAKGEQGGVRPVDVARVVDQVLAFRRFHLGRARIAVDRRGVEPGLHIVRTDGHCLTQVLLNLVINAEQALVGVQEPRIVIEARAADGRVEVSVADNGQGIGPLEVERVSEPFYTTKGAAAGLGLTVARALVEELGGTFLIQSREEGGTRAAIGLPRR